MFLKSVNAVFVKAVKDLEAIRKREELHADKVTSIMENKRELFVAEMDKLSAERDAAVAEAQEAKAAIAAYSKLFKGI